MVQDRLNPAPRVITASISDVTGASAILFSPVRRIPVGRIGGPRPARICGTHHLQRQHLMVTAKFYGESRKFGSDGGACGGLVPRNKDASHCFMVC